MTHTLSSITGRKYEGKVCRITATEFGLEPDCRFFWGKLSLSWGGVHSNDFAPILGGSSPKDIDGDQVIKYLFGVLNAVSVRSWEELKGKLVMALFEEGDTRGTVIGISGLDGTNAFFPHVLLRTEGTEA